MTVRILNIAILLAALVLSAVLVKKFFFQPDQNTDYRIAANAILSMNGINWADSDRTVRITVFLRHKECTHLGDS